MDNCQPRPGRNENSNKEQAGSNERLHLGKAEAAIVMFLPVIMVMEGQYDAEKEAQQKRARGRERGEHPFDR
jgi:hypothetical protein